MSKVTINKLTIINDSPSKGAYFGQHVYDGAPSVLIMADSWTSAEELYLEHLCDRGALDVVDDDEDDSADLTWVDGHGFVFAHDYRVTTVRSSRDD